MQVQQGLHFVAETSASKISQTGDSACKQVVLMMDVIAVIEINSILNCAKSPKSQFLRNSTTANGGIKGEFIQILYSLYSQCMLPNSRGRTSSAGRSPGNHSCFQGTVNDTSQQKQSLPLIATHHNIRTYISHCSIDLKQIQGPCIRSTVEKGHLSQQNDSKKKSLIRK